MRNAIIIVIVWALLIGFFVTGVRAISSAPVKGTVATIQTDSSSDLHKIPIDRQKLTLK